MTAPCAPCWKDTFPSKSEAEFARRKHRNSRHRDSIRAYRCDRGCDGWHFTQKER